MSVHGEELGFELFMFESELCEKIVNSWLIAWISCKVASRLLLPLGHVGLTFDRGALEHHAKAIVLESTGQRSR